MFEDFALTTINATWHKFFANFFEFPFWSHELFSRQRPAAPARPSLPKSELWTKLQVLEVGFLLKDTRISATSIQKYVSMFQEVSSSR